VAYLCVSELLPTLLRCVDLLEPRFGLAVAQLITSVCPILCTLHVVNFSHLDGVVLRVYD
jgi:hypothetical protein